MCDPNCSTTAADGLPCALHGRELSVAGHREQGHCWIHSTHSPVGNAFEEGPFLFLHEGRPGRCREYPVESKPVHLGTVDRQVSGLQRGRFDSFNKKRLRGACKWPRTDLNFSKRRIFHHFMSLQDPTAAV